MAGNQLAIYTIAAVGILSLIGTILPQRGPGLDEEQYEFLSHATGLKGFAFSLGWYDMFHSIWFYAVLLILCVNLVLCTTINFRRVYKSTGIKHVALGPDLVMSMDEIRRFKSRSIKTDEVAALVNPSLTSNEKGHWFYRESGALHRYGAIITHLAMLLMVAGAILGSLTGIDGSMLIPEGEERSAIELRRGGNLELPFSVECNDFSVEFYPDRRQPKTFRSDLTFKPANGQPWKTQIEVNHPARFGGYRFFQSTYGQTPARLRIQPIRRSDGAVLPARALGADQWVPIDDHTRITVRDVDENKFNSGLAAELLESSGGAAPKNFWIFQNNPKFDESRTGDYTYVLMGAGRGGYYTGLMVTRNPGLSIFWFGCAVAALGLFLAFFLPYRRLLVHIEADQVTMAYSDSRTGDVVKAEATKWEQLLRGNHPPKKEMES